MNGLELTARIGPGRMVDKAPGAPFLELNDDVGVSFMLKPGDRLCMVGISLNRQARRDDQALREEVQEALHAHLCTTTEDFQDMQWENEHTKVLVNAPKNLMVSDGQGGMHPLWGVTFISKAEKGALLWWGGILP
jgi:hypothetical protein